MENLETIKFKHPRDYLKIIFRRKWLIILPAYIGLAAGIIVSFLLSPKYEAYTVIMVEEEKIINPLIQGLAVSSSAAQRMQSIKERILGWNNLADLVGKLGLAKNADSQGGLENIILGLRGSINVQMQGATTKISSGAPTVIRMSYVSQDPRRAQMIVQALADNLVNENMRFQTKETEVAINFIKEQLEVYKRKIKESEISDLEEQLKTLLADSTEQHPLVKELRQKLTSAQNELNSGDFKVSAASLPKDNPAYQVLQSELDKIISKETGSAGASAAYAATGSEAESSPNASIYKIMLMDKVDSVLARDKNVNENIYNMLLSKLETARITHRLEISRQGTRYNIIDPARLPLKPMKSNKLMVIVMGLLAGAVSGTGLVFGKEFLDQSFIDIDDAKNTLELPVLGAISCITTQEEINKENHTKKKVAVVTAVSSLVLILFVMLYAFYKR